MPDVHDVHRLAGARVLELDCGPGCAMFIAMRAWPSVAEAVPPHSTPKLNESHVPAGCSEETCESVKSGKQE